MLSVRNCALLRDGEPLLMDISFDVAAGEVVTLSSICSSACMANCCGSPPLLSATASVVTLANRPAPA